LDAETAKTAGIGVVLSTFTKCIAAMQRCWLFRQPDHSIYRPVDASAPAFSSLRIGWPQLFPLEGCLLRFPCRSDKDLAGPRKSARPFLLGHGRCIVAQSGYKLDGRGNIAMTANAVVRARIDETVKDEATLVLAEMGLTVSDAVRIMLTKVARERRLPFELTPNASTVETLTRSERGEDLHSAESPDDLFEKLGI